MNKEEISGFLAGIIMVAGFVLFIWWLIPSQQEIIDRDSRRAERDVAAYSARVFEVENHPGWFCIGDRRAWDDSASCYYDRNKGEK